MLDVALAQLDDTLFGRRKSEGEKKTWLSSVNKIELELEPNPMTLQLLESAQRKYKVNDIEVILVKDGFCTLLGAILAYVMQAAIPKATGISNTYFELQLHTLEITSSKGFSYTPIESRNTVKSVAQP